MPLLNFDPIVGMVAPSAAVLRKQVIENWQNAFNTGDGSPLLDTESTTPAGQLIDSETMILAQINAELLYLFSQLNPRLAEGTWQDAIGYIYFLVRKIAQPTLVTCTCTGLQGTVIPVGAQIRSEEGLRYECVNSTEIPESGTVDVLFQCLQAGPVECPAESLTNIAVYGGAKILDTVSGWKSTQNLYPGIVGDETTATTVQVVCRGDSGTIIPSGSRISTESGRIYSGTDQAILTDGEATIEFVCADLGEIECPINALTNGAIKLFDGKGKIITVIPGWDTIRNRSAGSIGRNRESQVDFENRRWESVAKNSHGALASLQGALWDLKGVIDCRVLENTGDDPIVQHGVTIPGHSVAICIYGGTDADIAEAIYMKKDAGCGTTGNTIVVHQADEPGFGGATYYYNILRPTPEDVKIRVTINRTEITPPDVVNRIKEAIVADFRGEDSSSGNARVGLASTVYASRFSVAVVKTAGVQDLVSIEIKLGDDGVYGSSIVIDGQTEPVIEEADVEVVVLVEE